MDEEKIGNESNQEQPQITDSDIMQAFKELKKTTVPKSQYDDLKKQNKDLMECIVDGTMPEGYDPNAKPVDIDEIRKNLFGKECSNLEYAKNALALRDALIKQGKPDPFLPQGTHEQPHFFSALQYDYQSASICGQHSRHKIRASRPQ